MIYRDLVYLVTLLVTRLDRAWNARARNRLQGRGFLLEERNLNCKLCARHSIVLRVSKKTVLNHQTIFKIHLFFRALCSRCQYVSDNVSDNHNVSHNVTEEYSSLVRFQGVPVPSSREFPSLCECLVLAGVSTLQLILGQVTSLSQYLKHSCFIFAI